jgi:hypothetical protein
MSVEELQIARDPMTYSPGFGIDTRLNFKRHEFCLTVVVLVVSRATSIFGSNATVNTSDVLYFCYALNDDPFKSEIYARVEHQLLLLLVIMQVAPRQERCSDRELHPRH